MASDRRVCSPMRGSRYAAPLGWVYLWQREHQRAIKELHRSIVLDPSYAEGYAYYGMTLAWAGRAAEGVLQVHQAMKLDLCIRLSICTFWVLRNAWRIRISRRLTRSSEPERGILRLCQRTGFLPELTPS